MSDLYNPHRSTITPQTEEGVDYPFAAQVAGGIALGLLLIPVVAVARGVWWVNDLVRGR